MESMSIKQAYRSMRKGGITHRDWSAFIETKDKTDVIEVIKLARQAEQRLYNYKNSHEFKTRIRKYCNRLLYTDIQAYEVIKVVSPKCVEIRRLQAICIKKPQKFIVGGFAAHCQDNYTQEWVFNQDTTASIQRIHLGKKGWAHGSFMMSDKPVEFYDHNF